MDQAAPTQGPIGGNRWAGELAGLSLQADGQTDGLVVVIWIDRDELADLAEIPVGTVVEAGKDLRRGGDFQAHRLGEEDGKRSPKHRFGRPQAGRDVQFPPLLWGSGPLMTEPDPGRLKVRIRVDMPSSRVAGVARAHLTNDPKVGNRRGDIGWK